MLFSGKIYRSFPVGKRFGQFLGRHRHIGWLLRAVLSAFCCSLASMVFSLPLTAVHFGTVSLAALLVNPLCLWAVSILFTGGLVLCLTGLFLPGVGAAFGWILAWLARYVLGVVHLAAKLPFAAVYLNSAYWAMFAVALYGLVILIAVRPEAVRKWEALAAAAVCFACASGARLWNIAWRSLRSRCWMWGRDNASCTAAAEGRRWWIAAACRMRPGRRRRGICRAGACSAWTIWC